MTTVAAVDTREEVKQRMTQVSADPTNIFAVAYLQLCQVSYLDPTDIPAAVVALPPIDSTGSWQCIWGPAQSSDDSNLVFVAAFVMSGLPIFAAVVTRGTDVNIDDGWGVVVQIWEDMDVTRQVPLSWAPGNSARIAGGTADGLSDIQSLTSGGNTLLQFLGTYLSDPANQNPVLVVTGHSLGGCLTSVIAPWLQSALPNELHIVPATFAAPTAGNADFATYFQTSFGYSLRVFNSLDIVPLGWENINGVDDIYDTCNLDVPDLVYAGAKVFSDLMSIAGVSYTQPATNQVPLTGACTTSDVDWYGEALYQHHTTTYMTLLGGTSVVSSPPLPARRRSAPSRLRKRFGPARQLPKSVKR